MCVSGVFVGGTNVGLTDSMRACYTFNEWLSPELHNEKLLLVKENY